jgi:DNA polymerase-3 subunit delta'
MLSAVKGQDRALSYLRRVAEGSTVPLLLVGEEGTGKRFASMQLAKEMFCQAGKSEDCPCVDCHQIDKGIHPDLLVVSPEDGKDIGIDVVRGVLERAMSNPSMAPARLFILDGADRMTMPAANALLKTLEEPSSKTRFVLLAESRLKVIPTIRSRCGEVLFERMAENLVIAGLQYFEKDHTKALVYGRMAEGSLGRALRLWGSGSLRLRDQVLALIELGLTGDVSPLFSQVDSMSQSLPFALRLMEQATHDIVMVHLDPDRIYNVDARDRIVAISRSFRAEAFHLFKSKLSQLILRHARSRINLPFHVKTLFVEAFQEG